MLQLMDDTIKQIEARISSNKNGITGLPTGFSDLDRLTCGWQPGDEVVIAARPAVGKTSFALHLGACRRFCRLSHSYIQSRDARRTFG